MKTNLLWLGLLFGVTGCKVPDGPSPTVQDSLLIHVSPSDQEKIDEARARCQQLNEQLAVARADLEEAKGLVTLSDGDVATLRSRLTTAREQCRIAHDHRTNEAYDEALRSCDEIERAIRLATAQRRYHEDIRALAQERVDLVDKHMDLCKARLELAKARAVSALERPAAEKIDVDEHRRSVLNRLEEVDAARVDVLAARARMNLQRDLVQEKGQGVPESLRLRQIEPADTVFESKAFEDHRLELDAEELKPVPRRLAQPAVAQPPPGDAL